MVGGLMQERQVVIGKQMSWLAGTTKRVYHPEGDFDKFALIDVLCKFECRHACLPNGIVLTRKQWQQAYMNNAEFSRSVLLSIASATLMGCTVEIDDQPRGCITIEWQT
jgi:hypothetical protein